MVTLLFLGSYMFEVKWTKGKRLANLISQVGDLHGETTSIGYFKEQGNHPEAGMTYATLMAMHELRPLTDPLRRPVFEVSLKTNGSEFNKNNLELVKKYIDASAALKKPKVSTVLLGIGENGVKMIKPVFGNTSLLTPNTAATAASKGRNAPLVDFGYLKEALAVKTTKRKSVKVF